MSNLDHRFLFVRQISIASVVFVAVGASAALAAASNDGTPDEQYHLRELHTFTSETEASSACSDDVVVWAERYAGFYYRADEEKYGKAPLGAFACKKEAKIAGYWGTNLMESMEEYVGPSWKWEYPGS